MHRYIVLLSAWFRMCLTQTKNNTSRRKWRDVLGILLFAIVLTAGQLRRSSGTCISRVCCSYECRCTRICADCSRVFVSDKPLSGTGGGQGAGRCEVRCIASNAFGHTQVVYVAVEVVGVAGGGGPADAQCVWRGHSLIWQCS